MMANHEDSSKSAEPPFVYGPWKFAARKSHILSSEEFDNLCEEFEIPQLPEMTFGNNSLSITHEAGFCIRFNARDALKLVDNKSDVMKVGVAKVWKESRSGNEYIDQTARSFDWTYTTRYTGTIDDPHGNLQVTETEEEIDIERLKKRERILYFDEIILYEDELADNGSTQLVVKIRVMPSCMFVLMRYFLRVDGVMCRIFDTRLYHQFETAHLIREFSEKERNFSEMPGVSPTTLSDPQLLEKMLTTKAVRRERIDFKSVLKSSDQNQPNTSS